jgi:PAS domain S-box-containing protein
MEAALTVPFSTLALAALLILVVLLGVLSYYLWRLKPRERTTDGTRRGEEQAQLSRMLGLLQSAMDAVVSVNGEQKIVLFNPAAEKMFGYPADEALGQPLDLILPQRYREAHAGQIEAFSRTGVTARRMEGNGEVSGLRKDGREIALEASISQFELGQEKIFTAILRDTSKRSRAETALRESEEKYRTLVENANDGITIIQNGRIRYANRRLAQLRGEPASEIVGKRFDLFVHPGERSKIVDRYRRLYAGKREPAMYELTLLRKGNSPVPVELVSGLITYQGRPAEMIIVRDVSERKLAEQALQRQLTEMIALNSVATAGAKARDVDELIEQVTEAIGSMLYTDHFGVLLVNEGEQTWKPHYSYQGASRDRLQRAYTFSEGVVGRAVSSGTMVRLSDVHGAPAYLEVTSGTQSELAVPIFVGGKVFGCLNAESRRRNAFSEHDEHFLNTVADSLATAIEKIQLLQTEQRRRQQAEILYNTTRDLSVERDLSRLLQTIVERAAEMLGAPSGGLYLCDPEKREVRCVVSYNTAHDYVGTVLKYGEGASGRVAETGEALIVEDYRSWDLRAAIFELDHPFVSVLSVPMLWQERVIGVIQLLEDRSPRSFSEEDLQIARHFANQAAIAVENARLFEREQERRHEAEILRESTLALTSSMEPEKLFETILDTLQRLIPYDSASIELIDSGYVTIAAGRNLPASPIGTRYPEAIERWGEREEIRDPLIVPDVQDDERFVKLEGTEYIRGWMGIPLFARNKMLGFLNLDSSTAGFYTEAHVAIAQIFGSQAAIAIENMLLLQETKQHAREASAIAEIGRDISGTLQLDAVLEKIATYAQSLLRAETSAVYLSRPEIPVLRAVVAMGREAEQVKRHPIPLGKGILGNIAYQKVGEIVNDSTNDPRTIRVEGTEDSPCEHMMGVPVLSEQRLIGLIAVWRFGEGKEFKARELEFLSNLAQQVAVAIENARLFTTEQKRRQEADTLREAAEKITSTLDQEQAVQWILDQLAKVVEFKSASMQLLRDGYLEVVGGRGWLDTSNVIGVQFPIPGDNPNTTVVQERRAVILENAPQAYPIFNMTPHNYIQSWLGVPLVVRDRVIGMFAVDHDKPDFFREADAQLVSAFASQAAIAIENARLFEEKEKRLREMEGIAQVSEALSQTLELEPLLENILRAAIDAIPAAERGSILLADENGDLNVRAIWGYSDPRVRRFSFRPDVGYASLVFQEQRGLVVPDVRANTRIRYEGDIPELLDEGSAIAVPLIVKNKAIGVIAVDTNRRTNAFEEADLYLLKAMAAPAALAIDNARLFQTTHQRLVEIETVHKVSSALRSAQNLSEALPILLDQLMHLLNASGASLDMTDSLSGEVVTELARGAWASVTGYRTPPGKGISGQVIATGEPYVSTDVVADGKGLRLDLFSGLSALACVPVIAQNQPIGALWIGRQTPIHTEEVSLLAAIGEMVGNAIQRMRLNEQTIRRADEFEVLFQTARGLASQWELHSLLETVVTQAMGLLHASGGGIYLYDPKEDDLEVVVAKGPAMILGLRLQRGEGMAGRVLRTKKHMIVDDYSRWEHHSPLYENLPVGAVVEVPIVFAGDFIGVLVVYETPDSRRKYSESEAQLLSLFATQAAGAIRTARLLEDLQTSNLQLEKAYDTTLEGWARALELRDKETHGHSRRVTNLTLKLARRLNLSNNRMIHIRRGVLLHDIGKMGIPDQMLKKTGSLSDEEWVEMRKHPQYAYDLLNPIIYLRPALDIPYCHHEKWDGTGYPRGLKEKQIPLAARIFAIVDVYDALSYDRPYRPAWPQDQVLEYLREQSGRHFDPDIVNAFMELMEEPGLDHLDE